MLENLDSGALHRALLRGLLSCVAHRTDEHEYTGAGGNKFLIWPGSSLFRSKPKWIMAAEIVETSKRYGRTIAKIDPAWLESLGDHLSKHTYTDPHWHEKSQSVMAYENITLFGLPIVTRRRVAYGHRDVETSRQIFIDQGLVAQRMDIGDRFFRNNAQVRQDADKLASQTRKRNLILDDYQIHSFYEQRIPNEVYDLASLRRAIKQDPTLKTRLSMSVDDLLETDSLDAGAFPAELEVGTMKLPLSYHFEPGSEEDGVTLTVPASAVQQLHPGHLEWLVPGLVEEKLVALIRSLPKTIRRGLVPAPDTAAKVVQQLDFSRGDFLREAAKQFSEMAGERITSSSFRLEKLPLHLRMRIQVVDDTGDAVSTSRCVEELRSDLSTNSAGSEEQEFVDSHWHRDNLSTWDFGDIPDEVRVQRSGIEVAMFPAVVEFEDQTVGLRLEDSSNGARAATRFGVRRLLQQQYRRSLRSQVRWLPRWDDICLWSASLLDKSELEDQLALLIADVAFLTESVPRTQTDFEQRLAEQGDRIAQASQQVAMVIPNLMEAFHKARLAREQMPKNRYEETREDLDQQLANLLHGSFLSDTPFRWLQHFPRYLASRRAADIEASC